MALPRLSVLALSLLLAVPVATGCAPTEADDVDGSQDRVSEQGELEISKVTLAGPDDPADQYMLDVTVGRISEARWRELHERFSTERTQAYDATKSYKLVDFLPPFVKKTNGKVLVPHTTQPERPLLDAMERQSMPNDGKAYVDGNCHSVTWQWINHVQGNGGSDAVLTLMDGETLFTDTSDFRDVRADALEPGDVYFAKGTGGIEQVDAILHSGVYLGDGLVFEKGNPGREFPYRIAYLKDVTAKYKRVDPDVQFFYRRIARTPVLDTPAEAVSLSSRKSELGLADVDERILSKYQVQEAFDWETQSSVFTLGWVMPTSAAGADKFFSYAQR